MATYRPTTFHANGMTDAEFLEKELGNCDAWADKIATATNREQVIELLLRLRDWTRAEDTHQSCK